MFLVGYSLGFISCFILFLVAYTIVKQLIFKWGKNIVNKVENEIETLKEKTITGTQIIEPNFTKDIFEKEDTNLEDILEIK